MGHYLMTKSAPIPPVDTIYRVPTPHSHCMEKGGETLKTGGLAPSPQSGEGVGVGDKRLKLPYMAWEA
jgi:hypothetical protein